MQNVKWLRPEHFAFEQSSLDIPDPLPMRLDQVGHKPASSFIMHALLSELSNQFIRGHESPVKFGIVDTEEQWESVKKIRLQIYSEGSPHLQHLVNATGSDDYDHNSFVFFASYHNHIIGTVRLNRYPFEVLKFIEEPKLEAYLGLELFDQYLEVSRLAVDSKHGLTGVSNALVIYASLMTACSTQYKFYLAYSHPKLKERVFRFKQHQEMLSFQIPERRATDYVLFKGVFWEDFSELITNHGAHLFNALREQMTFAGSPQL